MAAEGRKAKGMLRAWVLCGCCFDPFFWGVGHTLTIRCVGICPQNSDCTYLPCQCDTMHVHLSVSHLIAGIPVPRTLYQMLLNSLSRAGEGGKLGILILGFNYIIMPADITCF